MFFPPASAVMLLALVPPAPSSPVQLRVQRGGIEYRASAQSAWRTATAWQKIAAPPGTQLRVPAAALAAWVTLPGDITARLQPGAELELQSGGLAFRAGLAQFTELGSAEIAIPGGALRNLSGKHSAVQILASETPVAGLVEVYNDPESNDEISVSWNSAPAPFQLGVDEAVILQPGEPPAVVKRPEHLGGSDPNPEVGTGLLLFPPMHLNPDALLDIVQRCELHSPGPCPSEPVAPVRDLGPIIGAIVPARCEQGRDCLVLVSTRHVFEVANPAAAGPLLGHEVTTGGTLQGNPFTLRGAKLLCKDC